MSRGDIKIVDSGGKNVVPVRRFITKSGQGAILAGEPVRTSRADPAPAAGKGFYAVALYDNEPVADQHYFLGIAAADSTETSSADGVVEVYLDLPGTLYAIKPTTAGNANTQAELDSVLFYRAVFDVTSSKFTITLEADSAKNALILLGGDPLNDEIHFAVSDDASWRSLTESNS